MATDAMEAVAADIEVAEPPPDRTETTASTGQNPKRKAETDLERAAKKNSPASDDVALPSAEAGSVEAGTPQSSGTADAEGRPLSKNQLKRLRKQQQWEAYKEDRRAKRKDKRHERQARKRAEKEAKIAEAEAAGIDPATVLQQQQQQREPWKFRPVPVSFIIDCDFEQYMREQELVSLSSQIVRSYAMNRKSKYQASLHFSSWKGKLKERFETVLKNAHKNWKNVAFHEGDFREAAKQAREQMSGPHGGELIDLIKPREGGPGRSSPSPAGGAGATNPRVEAKPEDGGVDRSVVYLTSESPYTLDRLEANTSYVIGGLVDRNREKGLCYKRAREYNVRTAKLPIGEYMAMQSRYVLTTNQVVEIMAKWLECGDWAKAFLEVIPKRKGGTLKGGGPNGAATGKDQDDEEGMDSGETPDPDTETPSEKNPDSDAQGTPVPPDEALQ